MPIPQEILKEHIIMALNALDNGHKIPPACESRGYDLIYRGKRYPPKYVIRLAYRFVSPSGEILPPFEGARMARNFLRSRDIPVFNKAGELVTE
jgi:5-methylcytosine-specific restriction protein B